jgi:hypothetical protein
MKRSPFAPPSVALLSLVLLVPLVACSDEAPGDSLETSVQAVSVSPTTVYPTPATSPSPGSSTGPIARWCKELAGSEHDQDRAIEIYREGAELPDPALAAAAEVLASGTSADDEALAAGRRVERSCQESGVDLTD